MTTTGEVLRATEVEEAEHVPGQPDMWFFVFFESLVFTSYLCVYLYVRTQHERAFLEAQSHLLLWLGVLDTIVLLTSSWVMARCVQHARAGRYRVARRLAVAHRGPRCPLPRAQDGRVGAAHPDGGHLHQSDFFQYYFFLTGIHAIHLLIGFVVLGVLLYQLSGEAGRRRSRSRRAPRTGTPSISSG